MSFLNCEIWKCNELKIYQRNLEIQADIRYHIVNNAENSLLVIAYTILEKGLILWLLQ